MDANKLSLRFEYDGSVYEASVPIPKTELARLPEYVEKCGDAIKYMLVQADIYPAPVPPQGILWTTERIPKRKNGRAD